MPLVISDSSTLIHLAIINQLDLLAELGVFAQPLKKVQSNENTRGSILYHQCFLVEQSEKFEWWVT